MSYTMQLPKACGCHHLTANGGITCTQGGWSYRCSACLRQERDEMAAERDEARRAAFHLLGLVQVWALHEHDAVVFERWPWLRP